jgi:threonyl-tRNA synthetase
MNKIIIQGTPEQFKQEELDKRQQQYRHAYQSTSQSCETIRGSHANQLLQAVIDRASEGYSLTSYPASLEPMNYAVQMRKPQCLQAEDLLKIDNEVKAQYIMELAASHNSYKELLFKQLVQAEELKQERLQQATKDKLMAKLKKEADGCYQPLNFPE